MAPTIWRFVDQPIASPTTLLDMNNGSTWKVLGSDFFQVPSPPLRRSLATNAMSDGGVLTSASYDLRTIKFTLDLTASTEAGREAQVDALKAQLAKPTNLLMFQSELSANPVFFRTLRSDEYNLDTQFIPTQRWRIDCTVMAEPFAIGIRHDVTAGLVVTNDPASGTNKTFFDITGVRGDSPAPAFARVAVGTGSPTFFWSQRTANNPTALTVFAQAEAGTLGTDTTTQANDANMSGASNNFVRTTFAANSALVTRLTVTVPTSTDAAALRGRYRVFAKIRMSATGSNFTARYVQNPGLTNSTNGQLYSWDSAAAITVQDFGIVEFGGPGVTPASIGYSGLSAAYATQTLGFMIGRNSGTATLDIDYIYLLPADERSSQFRRTNWASSSYLAIDGPQELAYGMASGSSPFSGTLSSRMVDNAGGLASYIGGWPMLVPGVTNRWYTLIGGQAATATSTWDVSYWPRWREVATS